jgi:hypothetical protein
MAAPLLEMLNAHPKFGSWLVAAYNAPDHELDTTVFNGAGATGEIKLDLGIVPTAFAAFTTTCGKILFKKLDDGCWPS